MGAKVKPPYRDLCMSQNQKLRHIVCLLNEGQRKILKLYLMNELCEFH